MSFMHLYPYTSFHEMNLDWVIAKLKEMDGRIETLKEEILAETIAASKDYIDNRLASVISEFNELKAEFNTLNNNFNSLNAEFIALRNSVAAQILELDNKIDAAVVGVNQRTDLLLQNMYNRIFEDLSASLAQIKVINYFTGEHVSIQDMFNYLAMLHLNDSIDYDTMALRAKTYTQFANMNITFTNLAMHGNTLYV